MADGGVVAVIGTQFGDEGKGRFIDNLIESESISVVARFNGGPNAGHRIVYQGKSISLHLMPSGVFSDGVMNVIGNGTVVNPIKLVAEIDELIAAGRTIDKNCLLLSNAAALILPSHIIEDIVTGGKVGTTGQGIGPAYMAKVGRHGVRTNLLANPAIYEKTLRDDLEQSLKIHGKTVEQWLGMSTEEYMVASVSAAKRLAPLVNDAGVYLRAQIASGKKILAEGAQATLLDINHGTYPFVTSSSTTSAGVASGLGIPPTAINDVFGVAKLTMSRVGEGPFPTEIDQGELADKMRGQKGTVDGEYGGTTGRSRRIGWFDAVVIKYAAEINGLTRLGLTKLDRLSGYPELKIAVAYSYKGKRLDGFTGDIEVLAECEVEYETFAGWDDDLSGIRTYDELPQNARTYIERIEELAGIPVAMIGVGPEREQMIIR